MNSKEICLKFEVKCVFGENVLYSAPPPPPPNSPEPQQRSVKTSNLVDYCDTVEKEDLMSRAERLARVDRSPIPPNARFIPAGEETDDEADLW